MVALGFRAHSGWAAVVAVAEPLTIVGRWRIELADPTVKGFPQPYHAAEPLPLTKARELIERCAAASERMAIAEIRKVIGQLGREVKACGLVTGSGRPLPEVDAILKSHALIHTAEGVMFREAIRRAAEAIGLPVYELPERQAREHLGTLTVSPGPPWREDQKLATIAALAALR